MLRWLKRTRKCPRLGKYPACDHLNVALMQLLKHPEENRVAIREICYAIEKADGYLYDIRNDNRIENLELMNKHKHFFDARQRTIKQKGGIIINRVILIGNLAADPESRTTQSGVAQCTLRLAVTRRFTDKQTGQREADFFNVICWRQTAEFISRYFRRGSALCITGSIQTRTWQDQQGQKRYATEVVADEAMFVDSKNEGGVSGGQYSPDAYATPSYSSAPTAAPKFEELKTDDDLPF